MGLFEKNMVQLCQCGRRITLERGKRYCFRAEYGIPRLLRIRDGKGSLFLNVEGLGDMVASVSEVEPDETGIKISGAFHYQQDRTSTELTVPFNALIDYNGQHGWIMI